MAWQSRRVCGNQFGAERIIDPTGWSEFRSAAARRPSALPISHPPPVAAWKRGVQGERFASVYTAWRLGKNSGSKQEIGKFLPCHPGGGRDPFLQRSEISSNGNVIPAIIHSCCGSMDPGLRRGDK
jgi:hypothetical protein